MAARDDLEIGPLVAAVGGILVFVSLFLDWYEPGISGWAVFETLDLLLAALGLAAVGVLAARLGAPLPGGVEAAFRGSAPPLIAAVALVVVAAQVLNHPPAAVDRGPDLGQWLALGGAALMVAGATLGVARLSVVVRTAASDDPTEQVHGRPVRPD